MSRTLDLHGVRHQEVDRMVENFILLNQDNFPLTIITGNSNQMTKLVKNVTNRLGCNIVEYLKGSIIIRSFK